jgi:hypothetical protein
MAGADVPPDRTPSRASQPPGDPGLEEILEGWRLLETEDETTMNWLVEALRAPGSTEELSGLDDATTAFLAARSASVVPVLPLASARLARSRRSMLRAGAGAAGVAASVVFVGAAAAAAYTGSLPAPLQRVAHDVVGAPAPTGDTPVSVTASTDRPGQPVGQAAGEPVGPAATLGSPALAGLCRAFGDRGPTFAASGSTAYRNLLAAATDRGLTVAAYCASLPASTEPLPPTTTERTTPPVQANRPSTPPGLAGKSTPPGQANRPSTPPGLAGKSTPPGQANRPSTPPGLAGKSTPPGQKKVHATGPATRSLG